MFEFVSLSEDASGSPQSYFNKSTLAIASWPLDPYGTTSWVDNFTKWLNIQWLYVFGGETEHFHQTERRQRSSLLFLVLNLSE